MRWAGCVLPSPPPERIALPAPVAPGARPPFPWIATVAPVVVSGVLWAVTGSALSLVFAALGPVVALGGVVDAARSRRGTARREEQRLQLATARVEGRIREAHERERLRRASVAGGSVVRFGTGDVAGVVELTGDDDSPLHALATSVPDAPLLLDASGGVGVVGPPALARAVARSIAVQLSPAETWHEPPDLEVFRRDGVTVAWAATAT
jgi:S-DNA-T family DNA segregation ATPase FtsK/SpoIIIE